MPLIVAFFTAGIVTVLVTLIASGHGNWTAANILAGQFPARGGFAAPSLRCVCDARAPCCSETWRMRFLRSTASLSAGCALYWACLRRPVLTWGASAEEARSSLPGDELLDHPDGESTRAIEIHALASAVWPWLAQMGPSPRGGAYTYDWIENLLGLNMHSVDRVLPEFQHPKVGETIGFGANRMRIERVDPERVLAWRSEDGNWLWTFVLREQGGTTRLISRNRFRLPTLVARIGMVPMEPASLVMERKMLLGIKQRAESLAIA